MCIICACTRDVTPAPSARPPFEKSRLPWVSREPWYIDTCLLNSSPHPLVLLPYRTRRCLSRSFCMMILECIYTPTVDQHYTHSGWSIFSHICSLLPTCTLIWLKNTRREDDGSVRNLLIKVLSIIQILTNTIAQPINVLSMHCTSVLQIS